MEAWETTHHQPMEALINCLTPAPGGPAPAAPAASVPSFTPFNSTSKFWKDYHARFDTLLLQQAEKFVDAAWKAADHGKDEVVVSYVPSSSANDGEFQFLNSRLQKCDLCSDGGGGRGSQLRERHYVQKISTNL